jgi:hypothetical protein
LNAHRHILTLVFWFSVFATGRCADRKTAPPFILAASDVLTNSVHLGGGTTNVYLNFRFERKSPEEIKEILRLYVQKQVAVIGSHGPTVHGEVVGGLVAENGGPTVGLVLSFKTAVDAKKGRLNLIDRNPAPFDNQLIL